MCAEPGNGLREHCVFCAIAAGTEPAEIICEGTAWLAFFPLSPATCGHTLVVPRAHVEDFWTASRELVREVAEGCRIVGEAIRCVTAAEGMNLISSSGSAAEQTVFHLHMHVVPRWQFDGFGHIWPHDRVFDGVRLENLADRLREACRDV